MNIKAEVFINTRPTDQRNALSRLIREKGFHCEEISALAIKPLPLSEWQPQLPKHPVAVIFTSANAVNNMLPNLESLNYPLPKHLIAIGQSTRSQLAAFGYPHSQCPKQSNSEGIMAMPLWQTIAAGSQVIVVTGKNGRRLIYRQLSQRFEVKRIIVYQRICPPALGQQLAALRTKFTEVTFLVTSTTTIDHLLRSSSAEGVEWLQQQKWLAMSKRISDHGRCLGICRIDSIDTYGFDAYFQSLSPLM